MISGAIARPLVVRETGPADLPKPRRLDRVRAALRARHYSRRTEEAYVAWIRRYIFFLWSHPFSRSPVGPSPHTMGAFAGDRNTRRGRGRHGSPRSVSRACRLGSHRATHDGKATFNSHHSFI